MAEAKTSNPRRAAVAALIRLHRGGWSNLSFGEVLEGAALPARERAFAGALFFGAAERLYTLDWLLAPLLSRPFERLDVEVRAVLEAGLYQLLWMRVPASAAVNESVRLARSFGKSSAGGMVNAVLRKAAAYKTLGEAAGPDFAALEFADELERVQVTWAVGQAVAKAVMAALPEEYEDFFAASFSTGELCLRANSLKTGRDALAEKLEAEGVAVWPGRVPGALYARRAGGVAGHALFEQGLYHVQGEASQIACACLDVQPGQKVLDVCAAPGGKSATLAQMLGGGAGLTACEVRENRVPLIDETLARLGIKGAQVLQNDGTVYDEGLEGQDRVLCDVPCSGLGTLAAKPDLRLANGDNFAALPEEQMKLLLCSARYVKEGGKLVYSTCTVRPEENEAVVQAFLREAPGYRLIPPISVPNGAVLRDNMMTLLPHRTGTDGFFVASMERLW